MNTSTITISFTQEQMEKLQALHTTRENQTLEQIAKTVVERGLYDLTYRTKRNAQQWQLMKQFRASLKS